MGEQFQFLTTVIQTVGIMLVAGLLLPLTRAIPGVFLRYWAYAWASLTLGLIALFASFRVPDARVPFLVAYCVGSYLFGFLVWAGCREFATGQTLRRAHFWALVPALAFGVVGPVVLREARFLFPFHAVVVGAFFAHSLAATFWFPVRPSTPTTGLWLVRVTLAGLAILFWHYAAVAGYLVYFAPGTFFPYLAFASLYDVLLETGLAFGMVVLASDRMREELVEKNRQLAAVTEELALAARTDSLTGLLNRRALDEMIEDRPAALTGSVAVLDLNDLKILNDRHGHAAGDAALKLVARAVANHFRVTDPLFRTGGDEFVVVMVGCNEAELAVRLAQIDLALRGQRVPGVEEPRDLVISWGVAGLPSPADLAAAVHRADEAMYACKRARKAARATAAGS